MICNQYKWKFLNGNVLQSNYCDTIFFYVSLCEKEDYAGVSSKYAIRMEYVCKIYAKLLNYNMLVSKYDSD